MRRCRIELTRNGTQAGDAMALQQMVSDVTTEEATHELQEWFTCGIEPSWETVHVGTKLEMQARLEKGKRKRRVIERA